MADNLIFPIGFDLEEAVKKAGQDWDKTYAKKLETYLAKRPIKVKLNFENLTDVKTRLAQLKIEPITPETRASIKELARELQVLAKALEQVQKYSKNPTKGAVDASKVQLNEEKAKAQAALAAQRAAKAEDNLAAARLKAARAANVGESATRRATQEFQAQDGYISRLVKRLAVYASFSAFQTLLTSIREVTAEFELQRVSLGAIIQDQTRANQLFSEIKAFALKSPLKILDLTKYTKQLAAYKIGVDELFETTKKLTDVSVGLGVSMDRVVLAYGQVRARGALYSSEIRQFTEMGVPIVEELATKLSEVNGELVTSKDVLKLVEKGAISFELVKEVFDDMTSAGGIFYNMQEKQGNTLYGMWAKLGDAASVMYEQIGNTSWVNEGMKSAIEALTNLMRNWKSLAREIGLGAAGFAIYTLFVKKLTIDSAKLATATTTATLAQRRHNLSLKLGGKYLQFSTLMTSKAAVANVAAANATNLFSRSFYKLKAAMLGNWMTVILVAIGVLIEKLYTAYENANRLKEALDRVEEEGRVEETKSVRNFEYLANLATDVTKGYKERKDALDELQRTYGKILPKEVLEMEYLAKLKGNYDSLTNSIRQYIKEKTKQKAADEVMTEYGTSITKQEREIAKYVESLGVDRNQAEKFVGYFSKYALDETKTLEEQVKAAFKSIGIELDKQDKEFQRKARKLFSSYKAGGDIKFTYDPKIKELGELYVKQEADLAGLEARYDSAATATSKFTEANAKLAEKLANTELRLNGKEVDRDSYLGSQMLKNENIKGLGDILKEEFKKADLEWEQGFGNFINRVNAAKPELISSLDFDAIIKYVDGQLKNFKETGYKAIDDTKREQLQNLLTFAQQAQQKYMEIVPSDPVVRFWQQRFRIMANSVGEFQSRHNQYLIKAGEGLEGYNKRLKDELANLKNNVKGLVRMQEKILKAGIFAKLIYGISADEVKKLIDEANEDIAIIEKALAEQPSYDKSKGSSGGKKSDPRLQNLKEEISLTKKLYDEYHKLEKQIGATKAAEKIQQIYSNTIKTLQDRATAYKFDFKLPFTDENLKSNMQHFIDKMKELQKLRDKKGKPLFPNIGKEIDEAVAQLEDVDLNSLQKALEKKLKELSDRISRTKTAKEFYEKILKSTGDANLALNLTTSIYGEDGQDLKKQVINQIKTALSETKVELPAGIIDSDNNINYKALREFAVKAKETRAIGEGVADELIKIAENGEKELSRVAQEGAKLLLKYDEIAQQRVNIEQEASEKIKALRDAEALYLASNASAEQKVAFTKRTNNAVAGVEADRDLELFKLKSEYLRYFSAIHSLTNKEANYVRDTFRKALFDAFRKGAISADKFKKEMAALNEQFDKLLDTSSLAMNFMSGGFDGLINKVKEMADEVENVGLEISRMRNKDGGTVMKIEDFSQGQKDYMDKMLKLFGNENTGNSFQSFFDKMGGDSSKMGEMFNKMGQGMKAGAGKMASAVAMVDMIIQMVNATIKGIAQIRDQLNEMRSEDNQLGGTFWDSFEYLENFNKYAYSGWEKLKSGDFVGASFDTVSSIISIFGTEQAQRIKRINKRIKEQQKAIEQLEYTYGRLEKAAEKLFGGDYVNNYNQQLKNLQAQQEAYLKQAEAEKSKGKKEDEEKTQEYLDKARDIGDQIADMQEDLIEHFTGSSRTDIARQMAQSWIDARASMSDTFAAIKGDYQDLIKNMLVETMAAKIIENAFSQVWKDVDERLKDNDVDGAVNAFINGMDTALTNANDGMEVWWKAMEARGFDMKDMFNNMDSEYTGIAKSVAGATSEEINNVAAIGNTLMYYVSPIPRIDENLARVVALMEGRGAALPTASGVATGVVDYTDLFNTANQHLSSLPRMEQHLAEIHTMLGRALRTKGATTGFNTFLNS